MGALRVGMVLGLLAVLAGCPAGRQSIVVDGTARSYVVHLPRGYTGEETLPLVLALHPFSFQAPAMAAMTRLNEWADHEGGIVVYPNGIRRSWNALGLASRPDDVAFIDALLDHLLETYPIDPDRVYAVGASNGAMMTYRLACALPGRFAAIGVVMGATMPTVLADEFPDPSPLPVLMIHGTADPLLPYEGGTVTAGPGNPLSLLSVDDSYAFWARADGCSGSPTVTPEPDLDPSDGTTVDRIALDACSDANEVVLYRVNGGGHTWPGGRGRIGKSVVGITSQDIDASGVVWAFFARHTRAIP